MKIIEYSYMSMEKNCQSCGMPMKKDPEKGGLEIDGSHSTKYCSYCYANGAFKQPNMTVEEMEKLVVEKMKEMGIPGFLAKFFAKKTPQLERWKK